jgi:ComF family protein
MRWVISRFILRDMLTTILEAFFPERISVDQLRTLRATPCAQEADILRARGYAFLDRLYAAGEHDHWPLVRKIIHRFKYSRSRKFALPLGRLLLEVVEHFGLDGDRFDALVPVPLHWMRRGSRGFNQAELLASIIAEEQGLPVRTVLRRGRTTGHQVGRNRRERKAALRDAFVVFGNVPTRVLLIDDVATTGATLDACAEALKQAGAVRVEALVIALG